MRSVSLLALAVAIGAVACVNGTEPTLVNGTYKLTMSTTIADSATLTVGSVVPITVHVTLDGTVVPGAAVVWVVDSGHGRLASQEAATDSLGNASALWVLGDTAGFNQMTVGSAGDSLVLHAHAIAGAASELTRVTSDSVNAAAGAPATIGVKVTDQLGNAVSGAQVVWTSSGGGLTQTTVSSSATGNAQTTFSAATPGTYTVTATLADRATVLFTIVVS